MANSEKAVYEDFSDDNYIDPFDEEDSDNERGPIVIVIALITLAALLGVLWVGVNLGRQDGQSGPPILRAETAPAKSVPENRGGLQIPHTDKTVFDAINGKQADEPEELLPPPEEPIIQAEAPAPEAAPSGAEAAAGTDVNVTDAQAALDTLIEEQVETPAASTDVPSEPEETVAALSPPPGAAEPAATPVAEPEAPAVPDPNAELQLEVTTPPVAEVEPVPTETPTPVVTDPFFVQVTSVRTRNDALAAWDRLQGKFGSLIAAYQPDIQKADLGNRGIYHRLRVGPLQGREAAANLCAQFKQQGQDCITVK